VVLFASVLALDSADHSGLGSAAVPLRHALGISLTQLGLLSTVTSLVGALGTLVFGVLVDKVHRFRLLAGAVALWALAMTASALSPSYIFLLCTRAFLGAITAAAGPAIASLTGDLFEPDRRARVYGLILGGEFVGIGIGFSVTGDIAALSWRAAFIALAVPAAVLAPLLWRSREPARGEATRERSSGAENRAAGEGPRSSQDDALRTAAERSDADAREDLVLHEDPRRWSLWRVVRYVLGIRTNLLLVIASVCSYYFFAGVRTFGVTFVRDRYGVSQAVASTMTLVLGIGAIVGVLASGRIADSLLRRGRLTARIDVAVAALAVTVVLFVPALLTRSLAIALPLLVLAALGLGALNPPVDAARLDIMPPLLWGRAEGVRSMLKTGAQAGAPLMFGAFADHVFSGGGQGLEHTLLLMLAPLAGSVVVGWYARRTYARDVATAEASADEIGEPAGDEPAGDDAAGEVSA
jgi:predicted MFS family arabinose efflux permease